MSRTVAWVAPVVDTENAVFDPANITNYQVYRNGALISGNLAGTIRSFVDSNPPVGSNAYIVIAFSSNGQGTDSPTVVFVEPSGIPGPSTGVTVT